MLSALFSVEGLHILVVEIFHESAAQGREDDGLQDALVACLGSHPQLLFVVQAPDPNQVCEVVDLPLSLDMGPSVAAFIMELA